MREDVSEKSPVPIGGHDAELRTIDLRTYRHRDEALRGGEADFLDTVDLWCVAQLESLVDPAELLRATSRAEPPYWALPWIGARAIAARMLALPPIGDMRVLDLGCGLGLAGVVAGFGDAHVTFADNVAAALEFADANARLHDLGNYEVSCVDFSSARLPDRFDVILAADIVYDPAAYAPLVDFLDHHLAPEGAILLTESLRADARQVIEMLDRRGIAGARDAAWIIDDGRPERTWVHTLGRV